MYFSTTTCNNLPAEKTIVAPQQSTFRGEKDAGVFPGGLGAIEIPCFLTDQTTICSM